MKKAMKYWALALCPILVLSCEKEVIGEEETSPQLEKVYRTVTFEFPDDPETKVSLAADGKTGWEAGDQIFIHGQKVGYSGDEYYSRVVTLTAGDIKNSGKTATFTFEDIVVDKSWGRTGYKSTMFAAYPASAVASYSNGSSWYYSTAFKTSNTLLLGGCNDTSVNDGNTFTFTHLSGVLSFVVDADVDSYVFSGKGGDEVVGYTTFAVRVDTQSSFGDKNDIPHTSGDGQLTSGPQTSVSGSVIADGSTVNYIYFPGGVNLSSGFTIQFLKSGDVKKTLSTSSARNIAMGKYLNLGDVTSHLKDYVAPTSHDATAPAIAGATDLGASGTANCYVVDGSDASNASKVFKFKAYKGNSSTNVGTISSVEVLWETYNDNTSVTANSVIAAVDYDKQPANDYYEICFQMPATLHAGNAVIAAKNSASIILWSWHIWVPSTTISSGTYGISTPNMMDRNLGALVIAGSADVKAVGLLYQWGRKDPFLGVGAYGSSTIATCSGTVKTVSASAITVEESIANPTQFGNATGSTSNYDWLSTSNTTLWGASKTIYDPCPPGWRVPNNSECNIFKSTPASLDGFAYDSTNKCLTIGTAVFPITGYLYYSNGNIDGRDAYVRVWSAHSSSGDSSGLAVWMAVSAADNSNNWSERKARGCSVRCVAE